MKRWQRPCFRRRLRDTVPRRLCLLIGLTVGPLIGQASESAAVGEQGMCAPEQTLRWRGATLRLENDRLAGTDRNYTNGVALALVSRDIKGNLRADCLPRPLGLYIDFLRRVDPGFWHGAGEEPASQNIVIRFGQAMYTPEDHTRTDLIRDDRPYAGLLYLGMSWNRRIDLPDSPYEMLDSRELTLGVIGPWSLAEGSQNLVHKMRGIERFGGWDHQLHNEPAFQLALERKFKPYADGAIQPGWGSDVISRYALRFGNIETAASGGIELRAGWNIPNDFGSYPIRPGAENRPPSAAARLRATQPQSSAAPKPGAHAFINLDAKAVAWGFSLDGNLFGTSHHVSRRPFVAQAAVGISSQWLVAGHGIRLALMRVWRSREFDEQVGHHGFASVALNVEF